MQLTAPLFPSQLAQPGVDKLSFKLNGDTASPIRVLYSPARLARLAAEAHFYTLDDRIGLIQDVFAFASAGYAPTSSALSFVAEVVKTEKENCVFQAIAIALGEMLHAWVGKPELPLLQRWGRRLFKGLARELGIDGSKEDDYETAQLRSTVIKVSARCGNASVLKELGRRFRKYRDGDLAAIPEDLRGCCWISAVKYGGADELEYMINVFKKTSDQAILKNALVAMAYAPTAALLDRVYGLLNGGEISKVELPYLYVGLNDNPVALASLLDVVEANWDNVFEPLFTNGSFGGSYAIGGVLGGMTTREQVERLQRFLKNRDTSAYHLALEQVYEKTEIVASWVERDSQDVADWLNEAGCATSGSAAKGRRSPNALDGGRRRCCLSREAGCHTSV